MGLLPAIAGYKIDVCSYRDDVEWFIPLAMVTQVMHRHDKSVQINRSIINKKSKLDISGVDGLMVKRVKNDDGKWITLAFWMLK